MEYTFFYEDENGWATNDDQHKEFDSDEDALDMAGKYLANDRNGTDHIDVFRDGKLVAKVTASGTENM